MSNPLQLNLTIEWQEKETDHSFCDVCDSLIIGVMWVQVLIVDKEEIPKDKVCKYCYNDGSRERPI